MAASPPAFGFSTANPSTFGLPPNLAGMYTEGYWGAGYWSRPSVAAEARLGTAAALATTIQTTLHGFVGLLGLDEAIGTSATGIGV